MKIFIQTIIDPENGQPTTTKNVAELKRESLSTDRGSAEEPPKVLS